METSCPKKIMRLAQLKTPKKRWKGEGEEGLTGIWNFDFFGLWTNWWIAIKYRSLIEDGFFRAIASFEKLHRKIGFIYNFNLVIKFNLFAPTKNMIKS